MSRELDWLTPEERSAEALHSIDPGFVNRRLIETLLRPLTAMEDIDNAIRSIPDGFERWWPTRINHIYSDCLLRVCKLLPAQSLSWLATQSNPNIGQIICSTDLLRGTKKIFTAKRVEILWVPYSKFDRTARLKFSTEHIFSTTHREALSAKSVISYVARLKEVHGSDLVLEPLVMGAPWVEGVDPALKERLVDSRFHFYEQYIEDIDEFSEVKKVPNDIDWSPMKRISERAFKTCIARLLGDSTATDWGGEMSDHFSNHLHLHGCRMTAAFLLKGPAHFRPMTVAHLGKNGDQIYRLASEPAEMLILQHSHEILPPVRATLRAFAVQPSNPRRYMLIDGRDSFRLLTAYNFVEYALQLSKDASR